MENPAKILCFGDSLTVGYVPLLEEWFKRDFPEVDVTIIDRGIGGETSRDAIHRLPQITNEQANVVLVGFGMNDQAKGITTLELARNLSRMITEIRLKGARVLLLTPNPVRCESGNSRVDVYCQVIRDVAREHNVRIADIHLEWKRRFRPFEKGLRDNIHPNDVGYQLYCEVLLRIIPRTSTIVLWQYNGAPCKCNYSCPYCTYDPGKRAGDHFVGPIERWHEAFGRVFGDQHLVFYFGHGEPMIGKNWFDVVEMIGSEPNWEMRVISNVSPKLSRLLESRVAKEGRLNINASFHPTETTRERYLAKLLECRDAGIEVPVVYTLWPPFFDRFEKDFAVFDEHNFLVHVRRFKGRYNNRTYPAAYTEDQRRLIARYADSGTIKYMLRNELTAGKLSWAGVDFMTIDNQGNVGYCDDYPAYRFSFGNVLQGNVRLLDHPAPFPPGSGISDGTVDGVACILELGYRQLRGNQILDFARQGDVYHTEGGVYYGNMHTDFGDPRVRAEYRFPPRDIVDCYYILKSRGRSFESRAQQVCEFVLPNRLVNRMPWGHFRDSIRRRLSVAWSIYRTVRAASRQ